MNQQSFLALPCAALAFAVMSLALLESVRAQTAASTPAQGQTQPQVPSTAADDELIGLWASETRFGPALQGEISIAREATKQDQPGEWRATLGGQEARAPATASDIRLEFPRGLGQFRGELTDDGRAISGWWLRPTGETEDRRDPGGSGQSFATPTQLKRTGPNKWRGAVVPLEDRFDLYLRIFRNDQGVLVGAFRNPDLNFNGGASHFRVRREGTKVLFRARYSDAEPEFGPEATWIQSKAPASGDSLRMQWPDLGRALDLTRRTPAEAAAAFPRPPGDAKYVYRKPPDVGDGWRTASASEIGMDEAALTRLVQQLIDADPFARRPSLIHSMLVAHRGRLVLDEYFFGYGRDMPHDTRSAGKTFSSVMLGAAIKDGVKLSPDARIYDVMASLGPFANPDPRKAHITLGHLMTHASGLDCNDYDDKSLGNEGTMTGQRQQPDWWKYTLDLPMVHDPGTRYAYCSANTNLVGGALTKATGTWLPALFDRSVARPLQFGRYHWNLMANGEGYQAGGAFVRSRDLLKVGQAYLDGGVWNGQRIVNADWVRESTAPHMAITLATTGLTAEQFSDSYGEGFDAYTWHLSELRSGGRTYREYDASGNGGQLLIVVPEAQLAVVFTAGNYLQGGIWSQWRHSIVADQIIPAIRTP